MRQKCATSGGVKGGSYNGFPRYRSQTEQILMHIRLFSFFTLLALALGCALVPAYWASLFGGFAFDDYSNVVDNPALRGGDGSLASVVASATSGMASPLGRPLSMLSFALNYQIFGESPFSFKVTNLAIHYANSLLVGLVIWQMLRHAAFKKEEHCVPTLAAALALAWALHPLNAIPVLLVVQRMTSLAAFFMLTGFALYLYGRQTKTALGWCAIALSICVCWPAAIYSKETGLLFPVYIVLCEWLLLGSFKTVPRKAIYLGACFTATVLLAVCWTKWELITGGYRMRLFTLEDRLYTETRVLWFYVQQMLLPIPHAFGLYHDDIEVSRSVISPPQTLIAIASWLGVIAMAYRQRVRWPLFAFAVFWFLASHLLESTILPLEIAHEHRNYLASLGLLVWIGSLVMPVRPDKRWRLPRMALALGFVLFCGFVTSLRSAQWSDDLTRKQVEVANHPQSARANYEFANAILRATFDAARGSPMAYELVHSHMQRAAELDPGDKAALIGVLYLDCAAGKPKNTSATTANLLERLARTPVTPSDRGLVQGLSGMLVERKLCMDDGEVTALISAGLSNPSLDGTVRGMLYTVAMDYAKVRMHNLPLTLEYAQAAVASDPGNAAFRINLIHLNLQSGKVDIARKEFVRLLAVPVDARQRAGLDRLKDIFEAIENNASKQ